MPANHLPTSMTQWLRFAILVYRCGGSAGFGSVKRLKHAPASRFTRRSFRSTPKTPAKHLTTSAVMLSAVSANGKLQTSKFSRGEDDPAGSSHCAQPDVRRYRFGV